MAFEAFRPLADPRSTVIPRLAEPADPDSWRHLVAEVDVVIDAVGGSDIQKLSKLILETVVEEARKSRPQGPPLAFICEPSSFSL